ncbi:hypothetical protein BC940DRAFT_289437, partial [Gongronella butleri]
FFQPANAKNIRFILYFAFISPSAWSIPIKTSFSALYACCVCHGFRCLDVRGKTQEGGQHGNDATKSAQRCNNFFQKV